MLGEKGGGFNGVWKNWVLFKNGDNVCWKTLILKFGFSLGGVGLWLRREEMDIKCQVLAAFAWMWI
jgi:hypothetical protein